MYVVEDCRPLFFYTHNIQLFLYKDLVVDLRAYM